MASASNIFMLILAIVVHVFLASATTYAASRGGSQASTYNVVWPPLRPYFSPPPPPVTAPGNHP
ncbi:hypothetical protein IHE45_04G035700 [Dioscorea alata]|uniref:Uncharacterized protein n=1 Tax=Dioscorea alata TaxID=55571 RepID=A0ACB7WC80_DIOAL|nr:hypothetical protein IHE45_04G035700 [Dioscorea alata]